MTKLNPVIILSATIVVSLALSVCAATKDARAISPSGPQGLKAAGSSLASKLTPQRTARTARSLSEMFEKVKSKIFGGKKQTAGGPIQMQASASVNAPQRQPWADMNSFNQQFSPYSSIAGGYQWPSSSNQYMNQYSPLNSYMGSQAAPSAYSGLSGVQSQQSPMLSGLDSQSQGQSSLIQAVNPSSSANNGLLSSASHLIAQYLSPTSTGSSNQVQQTSNGQQALGQSSQINGANAGIMTPQQQSQNQYSEFASILDSMVAQTGVSTQRQPNINQYLANQAQSQGQQGLVNQQSIQGQQSAPSNMMIGDNDMSGSSNIQSYMPASPQQASQKSSMVSLAEQLAPGAQFNKLVSFPFSLSSNEDPSKEGRYKLHIPFLNQHVKRSDQQQTAASQPMSGQLQQNYLNSYYSQQQPAALVANNQAAISQQSQQMKAQASQLIPTIVSPQSSSASSSSSSSSGQSQSYTNSQSISSAISSPVSSVVSSSSAAASPSVVIPPSSSS